MTHQFNKTLKDLGLYETFHATKNDCSSPTLNDVLFTLWSHLYGQIDSNLYSNYNIKLSGDISTVYAGVVVWYMKKLEPKPDRILLTGDTKRTANELKPVFGTNNIFTCGINEPGFDVDFEWDFEEKAPENIGTYDVIISHGVIEHILNAYSYIHESISLLKNKGKLIIATTLPGFKYHRFPLDALRFYPDWFEGAAKRLNVKVVYRNIITKTKQISYVLEKE